MGAMIVGMITGMAAWGFFIFTCIVNAFVMFFLAGFLKMNSIKWAVSGLVCNFYSEVFFVIALIAMKTRKCKSCGTRVENIDGYCTQCGESIKKLDDGKFALKYPLMTYLIFFAFFAIACVTGSILSELGFTIEL